MTELRIKEDGCWYWGDAKIFRPEILALFASHLVWKGDGYFVEMQGQSYPVTVEDVPFVIESIWEDGDHLHARLVDTREVAFPGGEIYLKQGKPYVSLTRPLDTKLSRNAYWQLSRFIDDHDGKYQIKWQGQSWPIREL